MAPLAGNLESVYSLYNLGRESEGDETSRTTETNSDTQSQIRRDEANPKFTNYSVDFKGTLDHILYNKQKLEVLEFLEMPPEELITKETALPSTLFPSDHMRIEAKFYIK